MKLLKWLLAVGLTAVVNGKEVRVIELVDFRHIDVREQGFHLAKDLEVTLEVHGVSDRWDKGMIATGWILNSQTREVVWEMNPGNSRSAGRRYMRRSEDDVRLQAGDYELYYAVAPRGSWELNYRDFGDFLDDLFGGFKNDKWRRYAREWGIVLSVEESDEKDIELIDFPDAEDAIVQLAPLGDDEFESKGFSLSQAVRIRVYAIGEGDGEDDMFDYGWIVDASTGERVWEMSFRRSEWGGGADKNRLFDREITLEKGDYVVHFVTDGSHSYDDWNQMAPYDPRFWGITLWGIDKGFNKNLVIKPYEPEKNGRIIVDLSRIGNNRFEEENFVLTKRTRVRILCLGEYTGGEFDDYGWIIDNESREIVWEMDRRNTRHAGGGRKNRMFDGIINMGPGSYSVFYTSDGSHSFRHWNTGPPFNPESWGITLFGVGDDFDPSIVKAYSDIDDPDIFVQITRVGDRERIRRSFTLDETARVRVYAIGEGDDDEMYDYGWIENERGRRVWRMDYWDTRHAGGGRKNRMINEVIELPEGEYWVYYKSDGSHSFEDWNVERPRDFTHWGITVEKVR